MKRNAESSTHYLDTNEAMDLVKQKTGKAITLPTMITWIEKYNLGPGKLGGRHRVDKARLLEYLKKGH